MAMTPEALQAYNQKRIRDFHLNWGTPAGVADDRFAVLHTIGAKSGQPRVTPIVYLPVGGEWAIFGSKGGSPRNPDWYYNLLANPEATIEIGTASGIESIDVVARQTDDDERDRIWEAQKIANPNFGEYERKAGGRRIPVLILSRRTP